MAQTVSTIAGGVDRFTTLPPELRVMIYRYLYPVPFPEYRGFVVEVRGNGNNPPSIKWQRKCKPPTALLHLCQLVRKECLFEFFKTMELTLRPTLDPASFGLSLRILKDIFFHMKVYYPTIEFHQCFKKAYICPLTKATSWDTLQHFEPLIPFVREMGFMPEISKCLEEQGNFLLRTSGGGDIIDSAISTLLAIGLSTDSSGNKLDLPLMLDQFRITTQQFQTTGHGKKAIASAKGRAKSKAKKEKEAEEQREAARALAVAKIALREALMAALRSAALTLVEANLVAAQCGQPPYTSATATATHSAPNIFLTESAHIQYTASMDAFVWTPLDASDPAYLVPQPLTFPTKSSGPASAPTNNIMNPPSDPALQPQGGGQQVDDGVTLPWPADLVEDDRVSPADDGTYPADDGISPVDDATSPVGSGNSPVDDGTSPVDDATPPVDDGPHLPMPYDTDPTASSSDFMDDPLQFVNPAWLPDFGGDQYVQKNFDENGFDEDGFDKDGFNKDGINMFGFDRDGRDVSVDGHAEDVSGPARFE